jgi:hypothetical protein
VNDNALEEIIQMLVRSSTSFVPPSVYESTPDSGGPLPIKVAAGGRDMMSPVSILVQRVAGSSQVPLAAPSSDAVGTTSAPASSNSPDVLDRLLRSAIEEKRVRAPLPQLLTAETDTAVAGRDNDIASILRSALEGQSQLGAITQFLPSSSAKPSSSPYGGLLSFLTGGFGLARLVTSMVGLFRRDKTPPEPPLPEFHLPESIALEAALTGQGTSIQGVSRGLGETVRLRESRQEKQPAASNQVTINVQALDSRSFVDHSEDIARAVRDALLHSHTLNETLVEM